MSELLLFLVILALLGAICYQEWNARKERAKFINALIAKTSDEFRDLELTAKVQPIKPPAPRPPDFIPESELSDKEFTELINREVA